MAGHAGTLSPSGSPCTFGGCDRAGARRRSYAWDSTAATSAGRRSALRQAAGNGQRAHLHRPRRGPAALGAARDVVVSSGGRGFRVGTGRAGLGPAGARAAAGRSAAAGQPGRVVGPASVRGSDPFAVRRRVAAVTSARIAPRKMARSGVPFRRCPPTSRSAPGSGWPSASARPRSACRERSASGLRCGTDRVRAPARTARRGGRAHRDLERWYSEELFARFAVLSVDGTFAGQTP